MLDPQDNCTETLSMAKTQKISSSKIKRAAITGATAVKIGAKIAQQKGKRLLQRGGRSAEQMAAQQLADEQQIGKLLFSALGQLRGTALKVSQLLSMEADLLPEGIRQELAKSCYQVTPLNRAHVNKVFMQEFQQGPNDIFQQFSAKAFAAASLGQVHSGITPADEQVAIKIQYPGIGASIKSDMQMLRAVLHTLSLTTKLLPEKSVVTAVMDVIEQQLYKELDYQLEAENGRWFAQHLSSEKIVIPQVLEQYSSTKILTTSLLQGLHLQEWLLTNPSQQQRNFYGQIIFDSFMHSAFELHKLHADPHPGNYLFMDNNQLGLLDFGCVRTFSKEFCSNISSLMSTFVAHSKAWDTHSVLQAYQTQGILSAQLQLDEFNQELLPLLDPVINWVIEPFKEQQFDFSQRSSYPKMDLASAKVSAKYLNAIPKDQIYFDRSLFGMMQILKQLGAVVNTSNQWIKAND
ncbi:MAG: AarF/ABC1/UbiB kinase family protein [Pseudomonadales bacterium]|nr:AarF/ABC1/UbiB kinase family protein [Pseudomonadales bacterium]NRA17257.1 AarF/ABC1/UbiB kinase family protein [Oceanospirillaceae bacterium]